MCNMNFILNPNYIKMNSDPTAFRASLWPPSTSSKRSASPRIPPNRLVAARRSRCRRNAGVKFRVMGVCKVFIAADEMKTVQLGLREATGVKVIKRMRLGVDDMQLHVFFNVACNLPRTWIYVSPFFVACRVFIDLCVLGKLCLDTHFHLRHVALRV